MSEAKANPDKKNKRKPGIKMKIAALFTIPLLVIALASAAVVITARTLVPDDVYEGLIKEEKTYALMPAADENAVFSQFLSLLENTEQAPDVSVQTGIGMDIDENTLTGTITDAQKNLLKRMESGITENLKHSYTTVYRTEDGDYQNTVVDYGEKTVVMPKTEVLTAFTKAECELNDTTFDYTIELPVDLGKALYAEDYNGVISAAREAYLHVFAPDTGSSVTLTGVTIHAKADAETGKLSKIEYEKVYDVHISGIFIQDYAALGEQEFSFTLTVKRSNTIKFAGITIHDQTVTMNKNGYQTLDITTNMSSSVSESDYTLTFASSDESICTVSDSGTVEAVGVESEKPVTVTATLTYLGKEYQSECTVWVITEADGIKISDATAEIKVGETYALSAEVTPKKATVKTVLWYSTDENICTVDENGMVTAVGTGTAQIIAVSSNGSYMEECHVTVVE